MVADWYHCFRLTPCRLSCVLCSTEGDRPVGEDEEWPSRELFQSWLFEVCVPLRAVSVSGELLHDLFIVHYFFLFCVCVCVLCIVIICC